MAKARSKDVEELEARLKDRPNPGKAVGALRLLDVGIAEFAPRIPKEVLKLLETAEPISVAAATARAAGRPWQDVKATLELQLRLVRARAAWEAGKTDLAHAELKQVAASASSRRIEVILEAAARTAPNWSPTFSLALLRAAATSLASSLDAALALVDAMTGAGEQAAAALILGQLIAGGGIPRAALQERVERLDPALRPPLPAQ